MSAQAVLRDIDPKTPFLGQLQQDSDTGPITLVNTFVVREGDMDNMIELWRKDSLIMKATPGFISAQLHRGIGASNVLVNVAVWESIAALREGFSSEAFQALFPQYPPGTIAYPHVLRKVAVENICTA